MKIKFIILITIFLLSSCSNKEQKPTIKSQYQKAYNKIIKKNYYESATEFEKLIDDYPFEELSIKGQIMAAYAYYMQDNYDKTIELINEFSLLYPSHQNIDYLLYLKAISFYEQIPESYRSQEIAKKSYSAFEKVIKRHPNSIYAKDSITKRNNSLESIASGIMNKAYFKSKNNNYIGAINDYLKIINNFSNSRQIEESYYRIAEIYTKIGVTSQANIFITTLNNKYPNSLWAKLSNKLTKI